MQSLLQKLKTHHWQRISQKNLQNFNQNKKEITKSNRVCMLDWIYQLSAEIQLPKQSIYNCFDNDDKYVSINNAKRNQYQKLGLACLFLPTKLQRTSHPSINTFLYALIDPITCNQFKKIQQDVAFSLKFKLNQPTIYFSINLLIQLIAQLKSKYENIIWLKDMPQIQKGNLLYRKIFRIMDGVILQGQFYNFEIDEIDEIDEISLAFLYTAILQKRKRVFYLQYKIKNTFENHIKKFNSNFEFFMNYAMFSVENLNSLSKCLQSQQKQTIYECTCQDKQTEYHSELKKLILKEMSNKKQIQ